MSYFISCIYENNLNYSQLIKHPRSKKVFFISINRQKNMILQYICFKVFPHSVSASSMAGFWIQGTRSSVSSPWLTEDGDELPYIDQTIANLTGIAIARLWRWVLIPVNNRFIAMPADLVNAIICEIWRLFFFYFNLIFSPRNKVDSRHAIFYFNASSTYTLLIFSSICFNKMLQGISFSHAYLL